MNKMMVAGVIVMVVMVFGSDYIRNYISDARRKDANVINVYSSRKDALVHETFSRYFHKSGTKVKFVIDKAPILISRLKSEGALSPADIFLTADIAHLVEAQKAGIFADVTSPALMQAMGEEFAQTDGSWHVLSMRSRLIFYAKDRVNPDDIQTYKDLADPKWKGKLLIRSSSNVYNQSLIASYLVKHGPEDTNAWLKGMVANFARKPQGGDTDQLRALAAGQGDIAVANRYYYARLLHSKYPEDRDIADKIGVIFPDQSSAGAHVNVTGAGILKSSKRKDLALDFLLFVASEEGQEIYATQNFETSIHKGSKTHPSTGPWQGYHMDIGGLSEYPSYIKQSLPLAQESGWR